MSILSQIQIIERKKIEDERGWFLKVITGLESNLPNYTGEVYITNANIGESKGGHYHSIAKEWFTLISGKCEVKLVDICTKEKMVIQLTSKIPQTLFVPNNIAHIFLNNGEEEFILLAYSDQLYLPEDTTIYLEF